MSITSANNIYGTMDYGGDLNNALAMPQFPRQKFKFEVKFDGVEVDFAIKSVSLPEISFDNKVVQQYNIKRVVQQKANYGPCTITLVDTFDNIFTDSIYLNYVNNYYNSGGGIILLDSTQKMPVITDSVSVNMGYKPPTNDKRFFINKITINMDGGPNNKIYNLHNCFITSINNDTLDYSESQPVTYTIALQPEFITIETTNSSAALPAPAAAAAAQQTNTLLASDAATDTTTATQDLISVVEGDTSVTNTIPAAYLGTVQDLINIAGTDPNGAFNIIQNALSSLNIYNL